MSTTNRKTFLDLAMAADPNGNPAIVIEALSRLYPMLLDGPAEESNADLGNEVTIRTALPAVARISFNQGIAATKSAKTKRVDTIGIFAGRSELDEKYTLAFSAERIKAERENENAAFIESMGQQVMTDVLYADENVDSRGMTGFAPRMASLSTSLSGSQVKSMGSVSGGDGTSIYIVDWGKRGAKFIYPKNGQMRGSGGAQLAAAGMRVLDKGIIEIMDANNNPFDAFVTEYRFALGLTVIDPRHIARLANIDISDANLTSPTQGGLFEALSDMMIRMASPEGLQRVIYCTRDIFGAFIKQANNKVSSGALTREEYLGKLVPHYQGFPIRAVDAIASNESTVS